MRYIFLFLLLLSSLYGEEYRDPVLRLIDHEEGHYLFRGKYPSKGDRVCFDAVLRQMKDVLKENGLPLDDSYLFVSVSLLNRTEGWERRKEKEWFQYQENSALYFHPIYGSFFNPLSQTPALRRCTLNMDRDDLTILLQFLKNWIDGTYAPNRHVILFLHCKAGKDRTGEVSACYRMQFHGLSCEEAIDEANQIAGRKLRKMSQNAILWYAFYLNNN